MQKNMKSEKKVDRNMKYKNVHNNEDGYFFNGKGEMMEAGEIDDMYDDDDIVEKELKSLLNHNYD